MLRPGRHHKVISHYTPEEITPEISLYTPEEQAVSSVHSTALLSLGWDEASVCHGRWPPVLRGPLPRAHYSQYGARQAQQATAQANSVSLMRWVANLFFPGLESSRRMLSWGSFTTT